jgi:hypothetical protein
MSKNKKEIPSNLELIQKQRGSWNGINPVTRVVESKKNKPTKHKKREMEKASET